MIKYRDGCLGCATDGYPCVGNACPNKRVPVCVCDICGNEGAEMYRIDGEHMCSECANKYIDKQFADLDIGDRAYMLNIEIERMLM